MASKEKDDQVDILPALVMGLLLIYLFYLVRPPVLLLWQGGAGRDGARHEAPSDNAEVNVPGKTDAPTPKTIEAPQVPPLLLQPMAAWPKAPVLPPGTVDDLGQEIDRLTNLERRKHGRADLKQDLGLHEIARQHSWDMGSNRYVDHISKDGLGPVQRVGKQHRRLFGLVGENVAGLKASGPPDRRLAAQFVEIWMNSPAHRRNLLSGDFNQVSTGCYPEPGTNGDEWHCTQLFTQAYAMADQDIPEAASQGQTITIRLRPFAGLPLPTHLSQVNLRDGAEPASGSLAEKDGCAQGEITLQGPPGAYIIQLQAPDPHARGRSKIVPGPYVTVR